MCAFQGTFAVDIWSIKCCVVDIWSIFGVFFWWSIFDKTPVASLNLCYLTINCDTGQHSQFLRCLYIICCSQNACTSVQGQNLSFLSRSTRLKTEILVSKHETESKNSRLEAQYCSRLETWDCTTKLSFSSRSTRPKNRNSQCRLEAWNWKEEFLDLVSRVEKGFSLCSVTEALWKRIKKKFSADLEIVPPFVLFIMQFNIYENRHHRHHRLQQWEACSRKIGWSF